MVIGVVEATKTGRSVQIQVASTRPHFGGTFRLPCLGKGQNHGVEESLTTRIIEIRCENSTTPLTLPWRPLPIGKTFLLSQLILIG